MRLLSGNWSLDGRVDEWVGLSRRYHNPRAQLSMACCHRSVSQGNGLRDRAWHAGGFLRKTLDRNTTGAEGRGEVEPWSFAAEVSADPMGSSGAGVTF